VHAALAYYVDRFEEIETQMREDAGLVSGMEAKDRPRMSLPEACTRCGGSRLVHLLWGYSTLNERQSKSVLDGESLLALNRRYFSRDEGVRVLRMPLTQDFYGFRYLRWRSEEILRVGEFSTTGCKLPRWACLDCAPKWLEVHKLGLAECAAEAAKFAACDAYDFERAALLLCEQEKLEAAHAQTFERLLRELLSHE
jgi:hypothetical protein